MDQDPFLQVEADVHSALNSTRPLFSSYLRIRSSASSASSPELVDARNDLESTLKDLSADLSDLVASVKAVETDPYRFGLEIEEVQRRRRLVQDVGQEIEGMRNELQKTVQQVRDKGKRPVNDDVLPDPDTFEEGDDYAAFEQERQMQLMHEQDEALDDVFQTVGTLKQQAGVMGRELEEQGQLLDETENVADRVGGKLQTGIKNIGRIIQRNEDTLSSCCIGVLIVVLIILLIILVAI